VGENGPVILPKGRFFAPFRDLLHAENLRHGANGCHRVKFIKFLHGFENF
jgi:hypothetical protein